MNYTVTTLENTITDLERSKSELERSNAELERSKSELDAQLVAQGLVIATSVEERVSFELRISRQATKYTAMQIKMTDAAAAADLVIRGQQQEYDAIVARLQTMLAQVETERANLLVDINGVRSTCEALESTQRVRVEAQAVHNLELEAVRLVRYIIAPLVYREGGGGAGEGEGRRERRGEERRGEERGGEERRGEERRKVGYYYVW